MSAPIQQRPRIRNGLVTIEECYRERGDTHTGSAHVHCYATSVIQHALEDAKGVGLPCLIVIDEQESIITVRHIAGPLIGRYHKFTPCGNDAVGWDELLIFVRKLMLEQEPCSYISVDEVRSPQIWVLRV